VERKIVEVGALFSSQEKKGTAFKRGKGVLLKTWIGGGFPTIITRKWHWTGKQGEIDTNARK